MSKRIFEPESETPELDEAKADVGKYSALEATALSEGGKIITETAQRDVEMAIDFLINGYKTAPEVELRAMCADLAVKTALLNTFKNAPENKANALRELKRLEKEEGIE